MTDQRQNDIQTVKEYLDEQMKAADCFATSCLVLIVQQAFDRVIARHKSDIQQMGEIAHTCTWSETGEQCPYCQCEGRNMGQVS